MADSSPFKFTETGCIAPSVVSLVSVPLHLKKIVYFIVLE